jgi:hypothetical protein
LNSLRYQQFSRRFPKAEMWIAESIDTTCYLLISSNTGDNLQETLLFSLILLLTASEYVPSGSGTTIHNTQYNTQKKTFTLKTIHSTKITNRITQNYKHNAQKQYDKSNNIHLYNYPNMI